MTELFDRKIGTIENDVLVGNDGHLFLAGGAHRVLELAQGKTAVPLVSFSTFEENIRQRLLECNNRRIPYVHVVVPDKHSVLVEAFPFTIDVTLGKQYIDRVPALENTICYPIALFREHSDHCFLRTDTHPSDHGIVILTTEIVKQLTLQDYHQETEIMLNNLTAERQNTGDLGSKLVPIVTSAERYLVPHWQSRFLSNGLPTNNGVTDIWLSEKALTEKRLLIFGDSVGRAIARVASRFFRIVVFLRTPYFHSDLLDVIQPDFVLSENVERYLSLVRPDSERPSFFMFPYLSGQNQPSPSKDFAETFSAILSHPRKPYQDLLKSLSTPSKTPTG